MNRIWLVAICCLGLGILIGFLCGAWLQGRNYERFILDPLRYEKAHVAAIHVNALSLMRIEDHAAAIHFLELILDSETLVLASKTDDPQSLPPDVLRAVKQIKTYRNLYPATGEVRPRIEAALAGIPAIEDYRKECQAGLCRLLEHEKARNE